jgi:RNA polymerase sigma-70 factor, ECF subfamily
MASEDEQDFASFYGSAYPRLVAQILAVTGNLQEAEDVVQEAFARASVRWQRLRAYEVPEAWVRRVAYNLAVSGLRRTRRRLALAARLGPPPHVPPLSPDHVALVEALGRLPLRQRQVLVLHHGVGLPVDQIARQLRVPVGSVKAWLARGRAAMARWLADTQEPERQEDGHAR